MHKKELFYTILVFIALEMLTVVENLNQYIFLSLVGVAIILFWATSSFMKYSAKKVSEHSDGLLKHKFKIRWYQYFFVPVVFYSSLAAYIFFIKQDYMRQLIILLGGLAHYVLFVHTRISYEKIFAFSRVSKVAFDLINVIFFFVVSNVLVISGLFTFEMILGALAVVCATILIANLMLSREFSVPGLLAAVLASAVLLFVGELARPYLYTKFAFMETVVFYMIISIWHIRLMGERHLSKYLSPVLFALMALILIVGR